jgi:hypothetical protein
MESEENIREIGVYAYESAEKKACDSSEGLALEQFFALLQAEMRVDSDRPGLRK